MATLLEIIQSAANRIGVPTPVRGISASDATSLQLVELAQQEIAELARSHAWQVLQSEQTWTATATEIQSSVIPDDFDWFIPDTVYNRTRNRIVSGPLTPQEWQDLKGRSATVVYDAFRRRGNDLLFMPIPTAGQTYAFEYMSKYPAVASDGTTFRETFLDDTDEPRLDSELVKLGVTWRFLAAKGLDYSEPFRTYERQKKQLKSRDAGQRGADMAKSGDPRSPRFPIFPDSSWNPNP